jgi:hypothetical protein
MPDWLAKDGAVKRKDQGACQIIPRWCRDLRAITLLDFIRKIAESNRIEIRRPD